ncbi:hypothetical protein POTOM_040967 [Populus tomentosa]|uniref:Uncharacterized protein n=1 Tax=Populus tomentosa TaxID=118781 RepID=A0A8X8CAS3_POPTO|nr:hypothetical protein POTOM_040967 [Populus tomentosa]
MPTVATRDTSATNRLIKKFVASSLKSTALDALSHLLSLDSTRHPLLYLLTLHVTAVEMRVVVRSVGREEMASTVEEGDRGSVDVVTGEGLLLIG